ncbi:hypothetical protein [Kribbella sp.]|uniref:hypothetical protein n=1 Tax=Kribbella sp. TaxID=1871183 RepID=UPI002D248F3E|nr:hypothetical protein [Kribbella sp.]HZX08950.1 hypothetical protein [Kribbella sp.]
MNMDMTGGQAVQASEPRVRPRDWAALVLLLFGPFLLLIGWLVGAWLLWTSNRWTIVWKVAGTLAFPVGWAAMVVADIVQPPVWVSVLIGAVIQLAVYVALYKEARA